MFPKRLETDRLRLEAITHDQVDTFDLYRHTAHDAPDIEEITEHLSWTPHATPKETKEFIDMSEENRAEAAGSEYVIRPKDGEDGAGEIAGTTGLNVKWETRTGSLGLWLRKPFWGRGYSGERASVLIDLAFDRLDLELVAVEHLAGNKKSRRAIEKYVEAHGGQYDGILRNRHPDGDEVRDAHRFTVSREQWAEQVESRD